MSDMTLERRVQRLADIQGVTQPMSRLAYPHAAGTTAREIEESRVKVTPGSTFEAENWVVSPIDRPGHVPKLGETALGVHRPNREVTFRQSSSVSMTPALQPEPPKPYDSFCESTSYPDKPARVERVVNNESEDQ
ncbi:hypothetical protein [Streptomyces sp. NPDC060065]|uniref:hypothetical protein n=1 Tax=Streptomyces sp. NPDC060065 TaxID=3347050 RepID=UPI00367526B5